jgi:hypothetical protein
MLTATKTGQKGIGMNVLRYATIMCAVVMVSAPVQAAEADDMERLLSLMAGTYDSSAQVAQETAQSVPEKDRHAHRHVTYARIDAPQIGPAVLFRQERSGGPQGEIVARGLAVFAPDPEAQGIRMWLRNIEDVDQATDLHLKPQMWSKTQFDPAYGGKCPFHWRPDADGFAGTLLGGGCKITSNSGKPMSFDAQWTLSATELTIFDNTYDGDGKLMMGRVDKVPTVFRRVKNDRP